MGMHIGAQASLEGLRKKVVIFTSSGGGGHMSVVAAISEALADAYDIHVAHGFKDVLASYDIIRHLTFNKVHGERLYNFIVRHNLYFLANAIYMMAVPIVQLFTPLLVNTFHTYLKNQKADMVISVVPIIDGVLARAAKKADIPCMVVPSDINSMTYTAGLENITDIPLVYTRSFDSQDIWQTIQPTGLDKHEVPVTGFPVRKAFLKRNFEKKAIKQEFRIPEGKPIIVLMMGAQGSAVSIEYVKALAQIDRPLHLIICLGKTADMWKPSIEKLKLPATMTITMLGFTDKIPELMAIADLFITKPGPNSICEALYSNVPVILDRTMTQLAWERFNHGWVKRHGFGDSCENIKDLPKLIEPFLSNTAVRKQVTANIKKLPKKEFGKELRAIVDSLDT